MAKYLKTEQGYIDASIFAPAPFKPAGKSYLTFSSPKGFTLKVNNATKNWDGTLEYFSADKVWTVWDGTTILFADNNDGEYVLYLRGTGNTKITGLTANGSSDTYRWVLTGSDIACVGNIENLLDYATVESGQHPTMAEACYVYMFYDCTSLTQAPTLTATTLANYCYCGMFVRCTSLTQAPVLPAITLSKGCYQDMFFGCTSLTQAPTLTATTLADYCYADMFYGCTSLTQAPALSATTLSSHCYHQMFSSCTSLTQTPALPATTLANDCYYYMFHDCTSLTKAPALPATTLAKNCYTGMFSGCTSLTQAPALPATTLANSCYQSMFYGCTSLTQAPALPATTLAEYCYYRMFGNCTSLKLSNTKTGEYTQEYHIPSSGTGTTASNALTGMFTSTGGTFTGTPAINTTYYLSTDNMIVRDTEVDTLNGYVGSMIDDSVSNPLNITGATVGQIAKITAVDTDGKPTAWKAVNDRLPNVNTNDDGKALIVRQISEFDAAYVLEDIDSISLGIRAASPGQIAKITAVDDSGKPTAWEAVDMPSGRGAPFSFDLIVDHTVTAEDLSVIRLTWTNETIQDLGKYNLFYAVIESDTEFGITKWIKFYINNSPVSMFAGSSSPKCKIIPATCNRFFGKWIGTSVYNPVNSVPFPVLVGPCESVYQEADTLKSAEDARSIAIGSYAADFGLAEGMRIKVYAMI